MNHNNLARPCPTVWPLIEAIGGVCIQANTNTTADIQRLSMVLGRTGRTERMDLCAQTHKHAPLGTIVVDHSSLLAARELARYLSSGPHTARSITDRDNQDKVTGTSINDRDNQASFILIITEDSTSVCVADGG